MGSPGKLWKIVKILGERLDLSVHSYCTWPFSNANGLMEPSKNWRSRDETKGEPKLQVHLGDKRTAPVVARDPLLLMSIHTAT